MRHIFGHCWGDLDLIFSGLWNLTFTLASLQSICLNPQSIRTSQQLRAMTPLTQLERHFKYRSSYLCEEEDEIPCSSDLVQDALQALGFHGEQSSESIRLQGNTLHFLGAERPLGNHCFCLTLQSDYRLINSVNSGTAGSINYGQALLWRKTNRTICHFQAKPFIRKPFNYLQFEVFTVEIQLDSSPAGLRLRFETWI